MAKRNILPVFIPHGGCRHRCVFCDQKRITAENRLPSAGELETMLPEKLPPDTELAFYGGSFTALAPSVRRVYLEFAFRQKERGKIGGIRLSTHPAYIDGNIIAELVRYGVDCVELGIQSTNEEVLRLSGRGHGRKEVFAAASALAASPLRWGVQLMVGLPGDDLTKDVKSVAELLPYSPDLARIYPVLVLKDTDLAEMWQKGDYVSLSLAEAVTAAGKMLALFSYANVTVIRMGLQPTDEISAGSESLLAGPFHPAFGYLARCYLKREQMKMALRRRDETALRFIAAKNDLPLLFGNEGENLRLIGASRQLAVGEGRLPRGDVGLAPYSKREKGRLLTVVTEREFLEKYTEQERSIYCI